MKKVGVSIPRPCDENWDAMIPADGDRKCTKCSRVVLDLRNYSVDEVEELLDEPGKLCVRAEVDSTGAIRTRKRNYSAGLLTVAGLSIGLAGCGFDLARNAQRNEGVLVGFVNAGELTKVTVTQIGGRSFSVHTRPDRTFRFNRLPAGKYEISFSNRCQTWSGETIEIEAGKVSNVHDPDYNCVFIGHLERQDPLG